MPTGSFLLFLSSKSPTCRMVLSTAGSSPRCFLPTRQPSLKSPSQIHPEVCFPGLLSVSCYSQVVKTKHHRQLLSLPLPANFPFTSTAVVRKVSHNNKTTITDSQCSLNCVYYVAQHGLEIHFSLKLLSAILFLDKVSANTTKPRCRHTAS